MRGWNDAVICFVLAAVLALAADLATKSFITGWAEQAGGEIVLIPGWLSFLSRVNPHALFSLGPRDGGLANAGLTIFASLAVVFLPIWAILSLKPGQRLLGIVYGAILGGAAGNLHDRMFHGGVRDFIDAHYQEVYHFPTFNLADSCLVVGAIFLVIASFWAQGLSPVETNADPSAAPALPDSPAAPSKR